VFCVEAGVAAPAPEHNTRARPICRESQPESAWREGKRRPTSHFPNGAGNLSRADTPGMPR
jgi:hypothetical protein